MTGFYLHFVGSEGGASQGPLSRLVESAGRLYAEGDRLIARRLEGGWTPVDEAGLPIDASAVFAHLVVSTESDP